MDGSTRLVVGICGPSGAGKSTLTKALVGRLGPARCARVPGDYFIAPRPPDEALERYFRRALEYDWLLLGERLAAPPDTVLTTPDFDFEAFRRRAPHGGRSFAAREVMLVDAMYPYPGAAVSILVSAGEARRRERVAGRDLVWGTAVAGRWGHLEATRRALEALCAGRRFDLVLDGEAALAANVEAARALIEGRAGGLPAKACVPPVAPGPGCG
jgi:energy-coupling factor transporter ATP-binding protein EcfA2